MKKHDPGNALETYSVFSLPILGGMILRLL